MQYRLCAYNLHFLSDIQHPEAASCQNDAATPEVDVQITYGTVPHTIDKPVFATSSVQISDKKLLLTVEGVARYLVADGTRITIEPFPNSEINNIRLYLFGSAMGALLYQRSIFAIHGSAVETSHGTMIFVGPQGVGKSTLAAHLLTRGYRLLSDDVCAITTDNEGTPVVSPAFPQLRLCPDAFEKLNSSGQLSQSSRFDVDKFVIPAHHDDFNATRLAAIYVLADHDGEVMALKPAAGFNRLDILFANLYRPSFLRGLDSRGKIMEIASIITKSTAMYELYRPRDVGRIGELIDLLESQWDELLQPNSSRHPH